MAGETGMFRFMRIALRVLATLMLLFLGAFGFLLWRLSVAPIALDGFVPRVEAMISVALDPVSASLGRLQMVWGGLTRPLDLRVRDLSLISRSGATLLTVPELTIGVSMEALLSGRFGLDRLDLIEPHIAIRRNRDGAFAIGIGEIGADPAPDSGPAATLGSPATILALLDGTVSDHPLNDVRRIAIVNATAHLDDRRAGRSLHAERADLVLTRQGGTLEGVFGAGLRIADRPVALQVRLSRAAATAQTNVRIQLSDPVRPSSLSAFLPQVAWIDGVDLPLAGEVGVRFGPHFDLVSASIDLHAGSGVVATAPWRPGRIAVADAAVRGRYDRDRATLTVDELSVRHAGAGPALVGAGHVSWRPESPGADVTIQVESDGRRPGHLAVRFAGAANDDPGQGRLVFEDLHVGDWSVWHPDLAPLARIRLPLSGRIDASLASDGLPRQATVSLTAAAGTVDLADLLPEPVAVSALRLAATADSPFSAGSQRLTISEMAMDLQGPTVTVAGTMSTDAAGMHLAGRVQATDVTLPDLRRLWPESIGDGARRWAMEQLITGHVDHAWLEVDASASAQALQTDGLDGLSPDRIDGGLTVRDVDLIYFKALSPIRGIGGVARTDGTTMTMETHGGRIDDLVIGDGHLTIYDMDTEDEHMELTAPLVGPVRTALSLLDRPPLGYPSKFDIDPDDTAGQARTTLTFAFPLKNDLDVDLIQVWAQSRLTDLSIGRFAGDLSLDGGTVDLDLDRQGMTITGTGAVKQVPAEFSWRERFSDDVAVTTQVTASGRVDAADVKRLFFDPAPFVSGPAEVRLQVTGGPVQAMRIETDADLMDTALVLPSLGWRKPPGQPGRARFVVQFEGARPVRIEDVVVTAADLSAEAQVVLNPAGGTFRQARFSRLRAGLNDLSGVVASDGHRGLRFDVDGARFDARPLLTRGAGGGPAVAGVETGQGASLPLSVRGRFDRVLLGPGRRYLSRVDADLHFDGVGLDYGSLAATLADGPAELSVVLDRRGPRERRLAVRAGDAGRAFGVFGVSDQVVGGRLEVDGTIDRGVPERPLAAQIRITDYRLLDVPALARLLDTLSVTGLLNLLQGGGLTFDQLDGQLLWQDDQITLTNLRTAGNGLGLTVDGRIDIASERVDLSGTIVPLYEVNRIVGWIPLLGDLVTGGPGEGLFAATYSADGPWADPNISVNPLAMLAPGILRRLFQGIEIEGGSGGNAARLRERWDRDD